MHATLSYLQAVVLGLVQGFSELFPVSSLGHGVLVPALLGWNNLVSSQASTESFFLVFLVGLHVGTALGLLVYYRRTWIDLVAGLARQIRRSRRDGVATLWRLNAPGVDPQYRLLAILAIATVPVGLAGLALEKSLRVLFAKPLAAAVFLTLNGVILLLGERLRGGQGRHARRPHLDSLSVGRAFGIGIAQISALLAGISRSGVSMVAGLLGGLDHEDSANFSFLLATPVILLAGLYKLPSLLGPLGRGVRVQALVGALFAMGAAYVSVRFLVRWFTTRTLRPFAIYCLVIGVAAIVKFH